ncbi:hypothetical protein AXA88_27095 [Salmonella enterica]|nr:hypothetical protein [Salmonella enterica]EAX3609483.1 hypothetical protein [Salmonella enterica]EGW6283034.1 hypothetical protein [Salmonella enterica]EGX3932058.1 hypothetical protein [Salmonella enterica]
MFSMTFYAHADYCHSDKNAGTVTCGDGVSHGNTNFTAVGSGSTVTDGATVVGNSAVASGWLSNAMGMNAKADGQRSVALGTDTHAEGSNSVALGNGAHSIKQNSVAIGSSSVSERENEVSIGDETSGLTRVLSDLAAGTKDNDAVNKKQIIDDHRDDAEGAPHWLLACCVICVPS